ncbi:MAG: hypothetical protein ABF479_10040 [Gluconacetobacter sp.]
MMSRTPSRQVPAARKPPGPLPSRQYSYPTPSEHLLGLVLRLSEIETEALAVCRDFHAYRQYRSVAARLDDRIVTTMHEHGQALVSSLPASAATDALRAEARRLATMLGQNAHPVSRAVLQSLLDDAWNGVGGWKR